MVEPTETEDKTTLDEFVTAMLRILDEAHEDGERLHGAPFDCAIGRPNEVEAARHPKLRYEFSD
jgi:glycine dehydrogenase subunit 2